VSSRTSAEPVRTCVGCRVRRPASELLRIVRTPEGIVAGGPSNGRGAWLCRRDGVGADSRCVETAIRRRALQRAWRSSVEAGELDALRRAVTASSVD
jgi:predicted RNA-binding protein YlxR (DUF448 family)